MGQALSCTPRGQLDWGIVGRENSSGYRWEQIILECPDALCSHPPELLGSTKRLNVNYQDADG